MLIRYSVRLVGLFDENRRYHFVGNQENENGERVGINRASDYYS